MEYSHNFWSEEGTTPNVCGFALLTLAEAEMMKAIVMAWREALNLLHWAMHKVSYNWKIMFIEMTTNGIMCCCHNH